MSDASANPVASMDAWYLRTGGANAGVAALLGLLGVAPPKEGFAGPAVASRRVRAGQCLFHQGAVAEALHFVAVGTFKDQHVAEDGQVQVLAFCGRGEMLGFDALDSGVHPTSAIALEDATVYAVAAADLAALCARAPGLRSALDAELSRQIARRVAIASLTSVASAEVRLARFLLQWSDRMAAVGRSPRRLLLRMSRRDIASYVAVAHETVSRSFAALAQWGCIVVRNREVEILDLQALRACARGARGPAGAAQPVSGPAVARCAA